MHYHFLPCVNCIVLFFLFLFCTFVQSLTNKKICLCILFKKNTDFFCLYFVISTFVYNVKISYWSITVQMYKTKIKKNKTRQLTHGKI